MSFRYVFFMNIHWRPRVRNIFGLDVNWYVLPTFTVLHILWNAKHFSLLVENNHLISSEYTDFHILINPFTANPRYWQCVGYISDRSVSSPRLDEARIGPMLFNVKNDMFLLGTNIILPKVLTLLYPVQPETLAVVYWNL